MAQESMAQEASHTNSEDEQSHGSSMLGPILCWAVVFADIGTSVYYTPGILYGTVGKLAGFFVFLTMTVFVLLSLKYIEVTHRFPQGGGVVTVAAQAINRWAGALGGMDALLSIAQMPAGIPVATVAIGEAGARNAGHLAAEILAVARPEMAERIQATRQKQRAPKTPEKAAVGSS